MSNGSVHAMLFVIDTILFVLYVSSLPVRKGKNV